MYKLILTLGLGFSTLIHAQQPEVVHSVAKEWKEESWYVGQQKAWKKLLDKNAKNEEAWLNYYAATRALKNVAPNKNAEKGEEIYEMYLKQCKQIVADAQKKIPGSFAAYYLAFSEKGVEFGKEELYKAAAINKENPLIWDELMIQYHLDGNKQLHEEYANKMYHANEMAASSLNWGYNLLAELEPNAILITHGDNDTYATWIIQASKQFRPDVTVINKYLFTIDSYRNRLLNEWGYPSLSVDLSKAQSEADQVQMETQIWKHLFEGKRPVHIASSGIQAFEEKFGDNLYLTGLSYLYSDKKLDNLSYIKRNYETRFLMDHVKESFGFNIMDEVSNSLLGTYLPSLIRLYEHYKMSEDVTNQAKYASLIRIAAEKSGRQEDIKEVLK